MSVNRFFMHIQRILRFYQNRKSQTLPAFSLIEIAFVLLIIGILSTAVFKGYDMVQSAKTTTSATQLQRFYYSWTNYREQFGRAPNIPPWVELHAANLHNSDDPLTLKIGNTIEIVQNSSSSRSGYWAKIDGLTPSQAQGIKNTFDEGLNIKEGKLQVDGCITTDGKVDLTQKGNSCTCYLDLN